MQNVQAYDAEAENDDLTYANYKRQQQKAQSPLPEPEDEVRDLVITDAHNNF